MIFIRIQNPLIFILILLANNSLQIGPLPKMLSCPRDSYNGTTKNIEQIFKGRCHYFLNILQRTNCFIKSTAYNCSEIWSDFSKIVVGKDPCDLKVDDFERFLNMVDHPIMVNTSLFWSGTYTPAHDSKFLKIFFSHI